MHSAYSSSNTKIPDGECRRHQKGLTCATRVTSPRQDSPPGVWRSTASCSTWVPAASIFLLRFSRRLWTACLPRRRNPTVRRFSQWKEPSFLPLLAAPGKVICIGVNYRSHREETGRADVGKPTVFARFSDTLAAHGADLPIPSESDMYDYEGEVALVVGAPADHVSPEDALQSRRRLRRV